MKKLNYILIVISLIASYLLMPIVAIATEQVVSDSMVLSSHGNTEIVIDQETARLTFQFVDSTPVIEEESLLDEEITPEERIYQISLPKGLHYTAEATDIIYLVEDTVVISTSQANQEIEFALDVSFEELADNTALFVQRTVDQTSYQSATVTITKHTTNTSSPQTDDTESTTGDHSTATSTSNTENPTESTVSASSTRTGIAATAETTSTDYVTETTDNYAEITSESTWFEALANPAIEIMDITENFTFSKKIYTTYTSSTLFGINDYARTLWIRGNGHLVDFRCGSHWLPNNGAWTIIVDDLTIYSGNYYGIFTTESNHYSGTSLTFRNVTAYGTQMFHAINASVTLTGNIRSIILGGSTYTSPLDPSTTVDIVYNNSNAQNFDAKDLTIEANSYVVAYGYVTGNLLVRGNLTVGEGATVLLSSWRDEVWDEDPLNNGGVPQISTAPVATTGECPAALHLIGGGSIDLQTNSTVIIDQTAARHFSGLSLASANSILTIAQGAKLDIRCEGNSHGNGNGLNAVFLGSAAQIIVEDGGTFLLSSLGTTGAGAAMYAPYTTSITVGSKATFDVQLDGTSAKYILYFAGISTININDAKNVNLQFNEEPHTNSMLIYMPSGSYLNADNQKVNAWARGADLDDALPTNSWSPMYRLKIPYAGLTRTNTSITGNATTETIFNDFTTHYDTWRTDGFQRLQFTYIAEVEVTFASTANDNPSDQGSHIVSGKVAVIDVDGVATAVENAYVRISEVMENKATSIAIDQTKSSRIASPVTATDNGSDLTNNFTVLTDQNGEFIFDLRTISGQESNGFTAGNRVRIYAYYEGKAAYAYDQLEEDGQVVLDKTAPTAEIVPYYLVKDNSLPENFDITSLITNVDDSNPNNTTFTYDCEADLNHQYTDTGSYELPILITDEAGNTATITSKITVYSTTPIITAQNFGLSIETLNAAYTSTQDEPAYINTLLLNYGLPKVTIISNGKMETFDKDDGMIVDLDTNLVTALQSGLTADNLGQTFAITYTLPEDTSTLYSEAIQTKATLTITSTDGATASTTAPINPETLKTADTEAENSGTGKMGALTLDYVPSTFDFGTVPFEYGINLYYAQASETYGNQWIQVTETTPTEAESDMDGWTVKARRSSFTNGSETLANDSTMLYIPFGTANSTSTDLVNSLVVNSSGSSAKIGQKITDAEAAVFSIDEHSATGTVTSVKYWASDKVALQINGKDNNIDVSSSNTVSYQSTITWSLVSEATE
ncbi:pectate lyase-like adhesive domain-containing protein [Enterococcus sp. DIV0876]|uniref:pectate lyase-like adhesive domain-containing protein n=1 Tax=Enterococcus sp. DIV0876 TaxID=2774633 RepID=UPI003D2FE895